MISLIVPFRAGGKRERNWHWLERRYRRLFPDWEIVVESDDEGPWCKGKLVNAAVKRSRGRYLVVSDADMWLEADVLRQGVERLGDSAWVVPHRRAYRLTEEATVQWMAGSLTRDLLTHDHLEMPSRRMFPCGGVFFVRRDTYLESGGFDQRFTGWGGEDESLGMKLETLYGPPVCLETILIHLYHQPQPEMPEDRRRPTRVAALVGEYESAFGNPDAMRALG